VTRPTLRTRKPIDRLTVDDLVAYPIWEYAIDEEVVDDRDETWVRPGVLLHDGRYVVIDENDASARSSTAKALGLSVEQAFPLSFTLRVLVDREAVPRTGVVE